MAKIRSPFELPEYGAALERERVHRVIAFHAVTHRLAGFEVTPMTLRQYSLLRLVDSPFVPPFATPSPQQLIQFLWILNPRFTRGESESKTEFFASARRQFIPPPPPRWRIGLLTSRWYVQRKCCELREAKALGEIREFIDATFADRQESGEGYSPAYYSDECAIIGTLAREYGWTEQQVMDMPLAAVFQHLKLIREALLVENGMPVLMTNPSDDIIQKHLAEANLKN